MCLAVAAGGNTALTCHLGATACLLDCHLASTCKMVIRAANRDTRVELRRCKVSGALWWSAGARVEGDTLYENATHAQRLAAEALDRARVF